jgi:hypothetical protein
VFGLILEEVSKVCVSGGVKSPPKWLSEDARMKDVERLLFEPALRSTENKKKGLQSIKGFFKPVNC